MNNRMFLDEEYRLGPAEAGCMAELYGESGHAPPNAGQR